MNRKRYMNPDESDETLTMEQNLETILVDGARNKLKLRAVENNHIFVMKHTHKTLPLQTLTQSS